MRLSPGASEPSGVRLGAGDVPAASVGKAAVLGVLAVLCAGAFISGAVGLFSDPGRQVLALPVLAVVCYGLAWLALREIRHAAWLDGTVLWVRGPFRTRGCDLATARILRIRHSSVWSRHAGPVPTLVAVRDDDGHGVRYPLVTSDGSALPLDLRAQVADAIEAGVSSEESRAVTRELRKSEYLDIGTVA
jgi:hypothetical protein